jgi:hypothetical protein
MLVIGEKHSERKSVEGTFDERLAARVINVATNFSASSVAHQSSRWFENPGSTGGCVLSSKCKTGGRGQGIGEAEYNPERVEIFFAVRLGSIFPFACFLYFYFFCLHFGNPSFIQFSSLILFSSPTIQLTSYRTQLLMLLLALCPILSGFSIESNSNMDSREPLLALAMLAK